jgi:hypothetical protein
MGRERDGGIKCQTGSAPRLASAANPLRMRTTVRATTERSEEKLKKNQAENKSDPKKMNQEKLVPCYEFHTVSS